MSEEIIATDRDDRYVRRDGVEERLRRSVCGAVVADFEDVGALAIKSFKTALASLNR
jgi:hypothetical protein